MDGSNSEGTIFFVKPKNEEIAYRVFDYLESLLKKDGTNFSQVSGILQINHPPVQLVEEHYKNLVGKLPDEILNNTFETFREGTIFLSYYRGKDIVQRIKRNVGETDPVKAEDWTVRGRFRKDSLEEAFRERRYLNNTAHASANLEDARREAGIWLPFLADSVE